MLIVDQLEVDCNFRLSLSAFMY